MTEGKEKYPIPEEQMFLLLGLLGALKESDYSAVKELAKTKDAGFATVDKNSAYDIFWTKLMSMGLASPAAAESSNTERYTLTETGRKAVLVSTVYLISGIWPHHKATIGSDAFQILENYIKEGDARSAVKLGELHLKKQGAERNVSAAFELFTRAAGQNDARGIYQLGLMHMRGDHVPKNPEQALHLVEKADALGEADAPFALFVMYTGATGGREDKSKVFAYLDKAVSAKHPAAMRELGKMYATGQGKPQDNLKAYIFYTLALAHFVNTSPEREAVGKKLTPPEWQIGDEIFNICMKRKEIPKVLL